MRSQYGMLAAVLIGVMALGSISVPHRANGQGERFVARVPEEFPTIQAAIDAVAEGGTVLIGPGEYEENLKITKSLRLMGAGRNLVKIHPKEKVESWAGLPTIQVAYEEGRRLPIQVYLAGFTVEGMEGNSSAISMYGDVQATIDQVVITKGRLGLSFIGTTAFLSRVFVHENTVGIDNIGGSLAVRNSIIQGNSIGIGTGFIGGDLSVERSLIGQNELAGIALGGRGLWRIRLVENAIVGNGVGVYLALGEYEGGRSVITMHRNDITSNTLYGIALANAGCWEKEFLIFYLLLSNLRIGEKVDVVFREGANNISNNGKADLCPPDYPWPPGFRK